MDLPDLPSSSRADGFCRPHVVEITGYSQPKRVVSRPQGGVLAGAQDNDMPTPIRFADEGGTAAWRARHDPPAAPHFPIWRFLLVVAALPLLLAFMAATLLAGLDMLPGHYGNAGRYPRLDGNSGPGSPHTTAHGHELGAALMTLVAVVGLVGLVWVVFALVALALFTGDGIGGINAALPAIRANFGFRLAAQYRARSPA